MPIKKGKFHKQNKRAFKRRLSQPLSAREITIIRLICQGNTNKEIADALGKSKRTIENDRAFIRQKIGCKNVAGVVVYAFKEGIVK